MTNRTRLRNTEPETDEDLEGAAPPWKGFAGEEGPTRHHDIYLSDEIREPSAYDELCHLLRQAGEGDTFDIYLNSGGGDMAGGTGILMAMQESRAHITTILHPFAFSMAAFLFLAGDSHRVTRSGLLMLHDYSGSSMGGGKGNEQIAEAQASQLWFERMLLDVCYPFISKDEISNVMRGRDLWLQADDVEARLVALRSYRKTQARQTDKATAAKKALGSSAKPGGTGKAAGRQPTPKAKPKTVRSRRA